MSSTSNKPSILVVEDDEFSQDFIRGALDSYANVIVANSGEQALHVLSTNTPLPDLVVVDIVLFALNGIEVTRHIRQNLKEHRIPIFVLSSHADREMEQIAYTAGATVVCKKGLSAQALSQRIQALLAVTYSNKTP